MDFAEVIFTEDNIPYSSQFDDVYFSKENGIKETEYVFVKGNDLENRWKTKDYKSFTIAETGFGTGLNLICSLNLWESFPKDKRPPVHFHSFEMFPFHKNDLTRIYLVFKKWGLNTFNLSTAYEKILGGDTKIEILPSFYLSVYIGDIAIELPKSNFKADAWFLDGYAPQKNPTMWDEKVFSYMKKRTQKNGTLATFTAAGNVRRGLTAAGFIITKKKGFGKKREMITGINNYEEL